MPPIRPVEQIARKWATVTPGRAPQYEEGVKNPLRDFGTNALAANEAWKAGTNQAIAGDRFARGVRKAGTSRWQKGAVEKGTQRYGPGVQVAEGDYASGFAPFREAIARTTLPAPGPRRSPQNLQRMTANVQAIIAAKEAQLRGA